MDLQIKEWREVKGHLIQNHPVGVNLGVTLWVQDDSLIGPEVCQGDLSTLWTHVDQILHGVVVEVILTDVSDAVCWGQTNRSERERDRERQVRETDRLLPSESFWLGLTMSRQLSWSSRTPSLSSSWSQSSPRPSLSESSWELLGMSGQLSLLSWRPSPSLKWNTFDSEFSLASVKVQTKALNKDGRRWTPFSPEMKPNISYTNAAVFSWCPLVVHLYLQIVV